MKTFIDEQDILEQAFQKALEGGWAIPNESTISIFDLYTHAFARTFWGEERIIVKKVVGMANDYHLSDGDKKYRDSDDISYTIETSVITWKYHLQQMILYENPLDYIVYFL